MPRYHFSLHRSPTPDTEGEELSDDEAARQEAKAVARDLSRNRVVASQDRLIVTNAEGKVIHEEPLCQH
jgi:hypothetical protein